MKLAQSGSRFTKILDASQTGRMAPGEVPLVNVHYVANRPLMSDADRDDAVSSSQGTRSALMVTEKEDMPGHLYFWTREDWQGDVPSDQNELQIAFDEVCAVLRARFSVRDPNKFRSEFVRLLRLAHAAFAGKYAQVPQALKSLEAYKSEIVRQEGPAIKNAYLKELALASLVSSVLILAVAIFIRVGIHYGKVHEAVTAEASGNIESTVVLSSVKWNSDFSPLHFGFLLASAMWGIWLSFVVRNMNLRFEQLQHPESDLMRPWSRLLAFGLLALILALFFQMQVLVVSIGGASTSQISDNALIAVFVGLGLGFTDKALPGEVQRRIEEFFQSARRGD